MKPSRFLLAVAVALMALAGCDKEKEGNVQAYITLSEEELLVSSCGKTVSVIVQSNYDWEFSYSSDWFTVENKKGSSYLEITYDTNETGADRKGTVTVTAGDGGKNVAEAELKITQSSENFDALIFEYTITANSTYVELPIYNVSNTIIDWGDGATSSAGSWSGHTYSTPGIYTVVVNGSVKRLLSRDFYLNIGDYTSMTIYGVKNLTAIKQWGDTGLIYLEYAFYTCSNLASLPEGPGPFSDVKTLKGAFYGCSSLEELPEGIFDYCSNVTDFSDAFYYCTSLTAVPENIFSNCPAVTDFSNAFYYCTSLTAVPENIFSNCPTVTNFSRVFMNSGLSATPSFAGCTEVTDFSGAFYSCISLTAVHDNIFSTCTKVTDFSSVFRLCKSLTTVPENMFSGCSSVTDFSFAFCDCTSLLSIPKNMFSSCSSVTDFSYAFYNCTSLTTIPTGIFDDSFLITDFSYTFYKCSSVIGESPYTELETGGEKVNVHLFERENYAVEMRWAIPTSYDRCFTGSTFSDIDSIPSGWKKN